MKQRRVSGLVLACLVLSGLVLVAAPAEAKGLNLHRGSHGAKVRVLETRLARLSMLPSSAVDGRFRAATVRAVRKFQWRLGLRVTGRVNQRTWNAIRREPARRAASARHGSSATVARRRRAAWRTPWRRCSTPRRTSTCWSSTSPARPTASWC